MTTEIDKNILLVQENKQLQATINTVKTRNQELEQINQDLKTQIAELSDKPINKLVNLIVSKSR